MNMNTQRGSSILEFAIMVPVFVMAIYASLYLTELGVFKLKAQEISRYSTWAFVQQPLSDFENRDPNHASTFQNAAKRVVDELTSIYIDLDAAHNGSLIDTGVTLLSQSTKTMSAVYQPPLVAQIRNSEVSLVPSAIDVDWGEEAGPVVSFILDLLGLGSHLNAFLSGPFRKLDFNHKGQITVPTTVRFLPPIRPEDRQQATAMARLGMANIASGSKHDLSQFAPSGRVIRDAPGQDMAITLVADPWRIPMGFSSHALRQDKEPFDSYARTVAYVADHSLTALPFGFLGELAESISKIPDVIQQAFELVGVRLTTPLGQIFSRPYVGVNLSERKRPYGPPTTFKGRALPGQVDLFEFVCKSGACPLEPPEEDAVTNFETGPMYLNPAADKWKDSGYYKAFQDRGPNFMGCKESQQRGCWE